jgi:putative endopeptidase
MVNINDKALANQIMTDVHAPAQFRINGPLSNIQEFYTTFKVKKGDKMYLAPEKRVLIW